MATPALPTLLTPAEVQAALRVSRTTFYRMVERGDLRAIRIGRRDGSTIRIPARELERLLAGTDPEED